jgi:outer membrane protein OmpA-like peptidoglycan-associated protein
MTGAIASVALAFALGGCGSISIGVEHEHDSPAPAPTGSTVARSAGPRAPATTRAPTVAHAQVRPAATTLPEVSAACVQVVRAGHETAYSLCADVLFAFDRATIRPGAAQALGQVARSIARRFAGGTLSIDGHTDSAGSPEYNRQLSRARAEAVKRWLVAHGHIPAGRITVHGYGETRPAASNAGGAGRAHNRRVVVAVTAA